MTANVVPPDKKWQVLEVPGDFKTIREDCAMSKDKQDDSKDGLIQMIEEILGGPLSEDQKARLAFKLECMVDLVVGMCASLMSNTATQLSLLQIEIGHASQQIVRKNAENVGPK